MNKLTHVVFTLLAVLQAVLLVKGSDALVLHQLIAVSLSAALGAGIIFFGLSYCSRKSRCNSIIIIVNGYGNPTRFGMAKSTDAFFIALCCTSFAIKRKHNKSTP
jgi:hypothetical protein